MDHRFYTRANAARIDGRQIDELIGLTHGLLADGKIDHSEVECLQKWLAANVAISNQPLIRTLYQRVNDTLRDGIVDSEEAAELFQTLNHFVPSDFELGETLKSTSLPLDEPAPAIVFPEHRYCFTGTFAFGRRNACEKAVTDRDGTVGSLTRKTQYLVVGTYATEAWKHSAYGTKIMRACELRDDGCGIAIVSESHWVKYL